MGRWSGEPDALGVPASLEIESVDRGFSGLVGEVVGVSRRECSETRPAHAIHHRMMDNQQVLLWILLGIGGGMTYGRWRAEHIRARRDAHGTMKNKKNYRDFKKWRRFY